MVVTTADFGFYEAVTDEARNHRPGRDGFAIYTIDQKDSEWKIDRLHHVPSLLMIGR